MQNLCEIRANLVRNSSKNGGTRNASQNFDFCALCEIRASFLQVLRQTGVQWVYLIKVCSAKGYLHLTRACDIPQPQVCLLQGPLGKDSVDELPCRCRVDWWDDTAKGKADNFIRANGPGPPDVEWVGSLPENHAAFPNWEVDDVWAGPREEHRWDRHPVLLKMVSNISLFACPKVAFTPMPNHNTWCQVGTIF